jgi:hypothetical protein
LLVFWRERPHRPFAHRVVVASRDFDGRRLVAANIASQRRLLPSRMRSHTMNDF